MADLANLSSILNPSSSQPTSRNKRAIIGTIERADGGSILG